MAKRKTKLPTNPYAWRCGILAVDPATTSGWAFYLDGKLIESGEHAIENVGDSYIELSHLCRGVLERIEDPSMPCVLVLERPFGGSNSGTVMALGVAHRLWRDAWANAGGSKRRIVRVAVSTWRSKVLQATRGADLALREKYTARTIKRVAEVGLDEAAAICIGKWASHAGEVGKVLPKRLTRAA